MAIAKLNLAVQPTTKAARASHPTIDVTGDLAALLLQFTVVNPQFKTLKNQSETLGKQISPLIRRAFFARYDGVAPESSTMLAQVDGHTVKMIVKNAYSSQPVDEAALVAAIGEKLTEKYFRQSTTLALDLDKAPEDKQGAFASKVIELAAEMGISAVVTAKQFIKPVAGFHEARTTLLSAAQNVALDSVLPVTAYPQL